MSLSMEKINLTACAAEFVAMTLFVIIGCGSATGVAGGEGWLLQVSLTFGFAITSLAYSVGHLSGGHINCAVTLGLVLTGNCERTQGLANFAAQMFGSVSGALLLCLVVPPEADRTQGLGSNGVSKDFQWHNAFVGEVFGTFLLVWVVLQTACHPRTAANRPQACIAIGFAVFLAHTVLIPIDGCSINPTRSFGPALVASIRYPDAKAFQDMWIFWAGPLAGAASAAGLFELIRKVFPGSWELEASETQDMEFTTEICDDKELRVVVTDGQPGHVAVTQEFGAGEVQDESQRRKTWRERWFARSKAPEMSSVVPPGTLAEAAAKKAADGATVTCGGTAPTEDGDSFACCMFFKRVVVA